MPGGVAPELNGVPGATIDLWLDVTREFIGLTRWRRRASFGHALLAAHFMSAVHGEDGEGGLEAGPLMAEANGPASRSFGSIGQLTDAELESTSYGRAFVALRRIVRGQGSAVVARSRWRSIP